MSGRLIQMMLDGEEIACAEGLPLTEVLAARAPAWRTSPRLMAPRGMFCGMGLCFECAALVDGQWARACLERTRAGMVVATARPKDPPT